MADTDSASISTRWPRADLPVSLTALALAVTLAFAFSSRAAHTLDSFAVSGLTYLGYWIPLLGAAALVRARRWAGPKGIAWRFTPLDLLWGLGAGLLLRAMASSAELVVRGQVASPGLALPSGLSELELVAIVTLTIIAPVFVAPIVEELFFRGTLLGSFEPPPGKTGARVFAVIASTALFALPHAIGATSADDGVVTVVVAAILGAGVGTLTVTTRRIGAAVLAHLAFNGSLFLPLMG